MLIVFRSEADIYLTHLRALLPDGRGTARVAKPPRFEGSPLFVLLGTRALGDIRARLVDVASMAPDWAYLTAGRDLLPDGRVKVADATEVALEALSARERDIDVLDRVASGLSVEDLDPSSQRATALLAELSGLLDQGTATMTKGGHMAFRSQDLVVAAAWELGSRIHGRSDPAVPIASRCRHCKAPFATTGRDEVYCKRTAPGEPVGGRTCQHVGPQRTYEATRTPLETKYRAEYKRLYLRQARDLFTREALDVWLSEARSLLDLATGEGWSLAKYEAELGRIAPIEQKEA